MCVRAGVHPRVVVGRVFIVVAEQRPSRPVAAPRPPPRALPRFPLTLFPSAHPVFPRAQVTGDWSAGGTAAAAVACATGKFFDPNGLQCLTCPNGASVAADGLSCECAANTYWQGSDGTDPYGTCVSCRAEHGGVLGQHHVHVV